MPQNEAETTALLRECDAGIKMGVASIAEVLDQIKSQELYRCLSDCKREHEYLGRELEELLRRCGEDGKQPTAIAKGMSWLKTNVKMAAAPGDDTVADLMTDGCNMGVKSLSQYLNQYKAADETSKDITKRLIALEERLAVDIRGFL